MIQHSMLIKNNFIFLLTKFQILGIIYLRVKTNFNGRIKIPEFVSKLNELNPEKVEDFNSNNAWGFGGAFGQRFYYKNNTVVVTFATACYRHIKASQFIRVDNLGNVIADVASIPKNRKKVIEKLISIGV